MAVDVGRTAVPREQWSEHERVGQDEHAARVEEHGIESGHPGAAQPSSSSQEGGHLRPDLGNLGLVLCAECVVRRHERVPGALVHRDGGVLAERGQLLLEMHRGRRREEVVVFGHVTLDRRLDLGVVGLAVAGREAVERHRRLHLVGSQRGEDEREHAAHAEPDDTDAVAGGGVVVGEEVDGAAHVATGTIRRHRVHQLGRTVDLVWPASSLRGTDRARGRRARRSEPIRDLLDARVEAPPLLDHDDAGAGAAIGEREVSGDASLPLLAKVTMFSPYPQT